jgi:hypothetical protein
MRPNLRRPDPEHRALQRRFDDAYKYLIQQNYFYSESFVMDYFRQVRRPVQTEPPGYPAFLSKESKNAVRLPQSVCVFYTDPVQQ